MPDWTSIYRPQANLILQGNPALDDLKQTYARNQAQKAQDNANFTSQIAKLNFGGAKDADFPTLQKGFNDILDTFKKLRSTNDPNQRGALGLELQQKQNALLYQSEQSKEHHKEELAKQALTNNPNANLADNFKDLWTDVNNTPSTDPSYMEKVNKLNSNMFAPKADLAKILGDAFTGTKSESKSTGDVEKDKTTGLYKTPTYNTTEVKPDDFANHVMTQLKGDHNKMKAVVAAYPTLPPDQAVQKFIQDGYAMHKNKMGTDTTYSGQFESLGQREMMMERGARLRQQYGAGVIPGSPPVPQTVPITFKSNNPNGTPISMNLRNAVPIGIAKATVIPTTAIDDHGQEIKLNGGEYRVIEKGEKPVLNQDIDVTTNGKKTTLKKGSLAQPGFETSHPDAVTTEPVYHIQQDHKGATRNFYVPIGSVSVNPTGQKNQTTAIKSGAPTTNPVKQYNIKGKPYKEDAVMKAAKASGMTVDEYLKEINK